MFQLMVNGEEINVEEDKRLLRVLRDDLKLKSVKDGCSEGACGTCHVLVDGKATKTCVQNVSRFAGKHIVTVEGLSQREKDVFVYAFGEAGAVQCGFCIPGMVIAAKGLLDVNPSPTREEAAFAIRNNICRCTGYKKIIDGIMLAALMFRDNVTIPEDHKSWKIGERVRRVDVKEKVLGTGEYVDDMEMEGLLHASCLRSEYPRARVRGIKMEKALETEGIVAIFTADDIPGTVKVGHLKKDWDTLIPIGSITRYVGDAICLVVGETVEAVEAAKKLVEVDYEELPMVRNPVEAMKEDAPLVHEEGNLLTTRHVKRGNAKEAIENSKFVVTGEFHTPFTEHAFLEPESAIAKPYEDGVMIYSTDQGVYATQHECADMLGLKPEQVRVVNKLVGGGFGGKEDMSVQHHASLAALLLQKPVKVSLSRADSIKIHPKRHAMDVKTTIGCDENGMIQGVMSEVISDTGAYASLGASVLERACTHAAGPYNYQNFEITGKAYYTNNPPGGAFRGFGVTQTCFATECLLDELAEKAGISPWEIRYRNAIRPGQELPNGQIVDDSTGLVETLEAVKDIVEKNKYVGLACAMKNAGVGVGIPDTGRCSLAVKDGKLHIRAGASCIGQGLGTVLVQMVCESTGLTREQLVYDASNTINAPDSGVTSGSRQTLVTGEAARRACEKFNEARKERSLESMEGEEFYGEYLTVTDPLGAEKPNPISHVAYGYATQVAILNEQGEVTEIVAAHSVGRAINPLSLEGQIEGGVIMSYGFALTEDYPLTDCRPTAKYGTLGLPKANKVPEVTSIIVEREGLDVAYGAIGIGEITSIPTPPAIRNAYYKFDHELRYELPLKNTPYSKKVKAKK